MDATFLFEALHDGLGEPITYLTEDGEVIGPVPACPRNSDETATVGGIAVAERTLVWEIIKTNLVRADDTLHRPSKGDVIEGKGTRWRVSEADDQDPDGYAWLPTCYEIGPA